MVARTFVPGGTNPSAAIVYPTNKFGLLNCKHFLRYTQTFVENIKVPKITLKAHFQLHTVKKQYSFLFVFYDKNDHNHFHGKVNVDLYSAFIMTHLRSAFTYFYFCYDFYLQTIPCLPLLCNRSGDCDTTDRVADT